MTPTAIFFITTARSATQWLAASLGGAYGDLLDVEHEPMGYRYAPCRTLRDRRALDALGRDPEIAAHFDRVRATLAAGRSYVEVGFPAFALAPLLRREFGDALRLVQLTRDPVRVAASLVTHRWYVGEGREDVRGTVALSPADPGARLEGYAPRWDAMSAFEKGLYYWGETHRWGLEVEAGASPGAFARFRAEDLVAPDPAERLRLARFLDLPERAVWRAPPERSVDAHRRTTDEAIDPAQIARHPQIVGLAERFGYAATGTDAQALTRRYRRGAARRLLRATRRGVRRAVSILLG